MISRELVKATLEFRNKHDRAPRQLWTLPWAEQHNKEEFDYITHKYTWDIGGPAVIYREQSTVSRGDPYKAGEYVDAWGCRFYNINDGFMGEVKEPIVPPEDEEWEDTSRIVIPEWWLSFDIDQVNEACRSSDQFMLSDACPRPFEQLQFIRGTENLYIDLMTRPKGLMRFLEQMHDFYCRVMTKWAQTDVDGLMMMDDWGTQQSLLVNPSVWREIFKPMYRDYINIAHSHGKKMFMHSDGYTMEILPDLIELGLDAINTQIFCMGPENLKQFRGKITFWGEVCRQHILPNGTEEDVERAVKSVYDNLWQDGGCIAQCEFGPGGKMRNVDRMYAAWDALTANR